MATSPDKSETLMDRVAVVLAHARKHKASGVLEFTVPVRNGVPEYADIAFRERHSLIDSVAKAT